MQSIKILIPLTLCMYLFVPFAMAENITVPDKEQLKGMSYEEYSQYREKMRLHLENPRPKGHKSTQESTNPGFDQPEQPRTDSSYGRGYHSRNDDDTRSESRRKADRPRFERLNRGGLGHR
jgi:hypothetical protein